MLNYAWNEEEAREALVEYGIEQGIEQGREQGREQGIEHTAREMLLDKMDMASIMKYTHLSAERLAELSKSMQHPAG